MIKCTEINPSKRTNLPSSPQALESILLSAVLHRWQYRPITSQGRALCDMATVWHGHHATWPLCDMAIVRHHLRRNDFLFIEVNIRLMYDVSRSSILYPYKHKLYTHKSDMLSTLLSWPTSEPGQCQDTTSSYIHPFHFVTTVVAVVFSQLSASSSTSRTDCYLPSDLIHGPMLTMWFIVCCCTKLH